MKLKMKHIKCYGHRILNLDGTEGWEFYKHRRFEGIKHIVEVPVIIKVTAKNWEKIK